MTDLRYGWDGFQPTAHSPCSFPPPAPHLLLLPKALQPAKQPAKTRKYQQAADAVAVLLFGLEYPAMGLPDFPAEKSYSLITVAVPARKLSEGAPRFDCPSGSSFSLFVSPGRSSSAPCYLALPVSVLCLNEDYEHCEALKRKPRQRRRPPPTGGTDGYYLNLGLKSSSGAVEFQFQSASERCREHNVLVNSSDSQSQSQSQF